MSEDADFWDDEPGNVGLASLAFMALACALAWLICIPFDLCARLRDRTQSHPLDEQSGADWGLEVPHDGCNAA